MHITYSALFGGFISPAKSKAILIFTCFLSIFHYFSTYSTRIIFLINNEHQFKTFFALGNINVSYFLVISGLIYCRPFEEIVWYVCCWTAAISFSKSKTLLFTTRIKSKRTDIRFTGMRLLLELAEMKQHDFASIVFYNKDDAYLNYMPIINNFMTQR